MTPNPILKVLFTFKKHNVRFLLIGGQACIIYGAAEFSRDSDFVVLCSHSNLKKLQKALKALKAELIYVPVLEADYLERGHACHFRCNAKGVEKLRVDVISKLRGCEPFDELWKRRKTIFLKGTGAINIIGLFDLVQSKKTQRDKDWLMLKRLVDNDITTGKGSPSPKRLRWWFMESRSAGSLIKLAEKYPKIAGQFAADRPLLSSAVNRDAQRLNAQLSEEELAERQKDIEYWAPLKKELEALRHNKQNLALR